MFRCRLESQFNSNFTYENNKDLISSMLRLKLESE
jgi:hypothetical protein